MIPTSLDRAIVIQQYTLNSPPQNAHGEPDGSWTTLHDTFANARQQSAKEIFLHGRLAEIDVVFTTRYYSDVDETCRIVYNSKNYGITGIKELGRQNGLEITAKAQE